MRGPATAALAAALVIAACGPPPPPRTGGGGRGALDAGGDGVVTGGGAPAGGGLPELGPWIPPPAPADDGFDALWPLTAEPSVPPVFGKLRPGMPRGDAARARPKEWNGAWTVKAPGAIEAIAHAGQADESDNPLELLTLTIDHADTLSHLHAAWGAPDVRGADGATACWLAPSSGLKACFSTEFGKATVELGAYQPLAEALAGARTLGALAAHLGAPRADVVKAHPLFVENLDPEARWLAVHLPSTEYAAGAGPDRVVYFLDRGERVDEIAVRFGGHDPTLRPALVATLTAAARDTEAGASGLHATLLEEPLDVVIVLSRRDDLR